VAIIIEGARSRWRRVALAGGGNAVRNEKSAPRPAALIREVCLIGDPGRRYRHRPEVAARIGAAGQGS